MEHKEDLTMHTYSTLDGKTENIWYDPLTHTRMIDGYSPISTGFSSSYNSHIWSMSTVLWEDSKKEEVENSVNIINKSSNINGEHILICKDSTDLATDRILKTLSAIKGKLMAEISPIYIQKIECSITPEIRKNLVIAGKKLKMYGKKQPVIARFDEYGNRLPDELNLTDISQGIELKIVDPNNYGALYLEMKATELPNIEYKVRNGVINYGALF